MHTCQTTRLLSYLISCWELKCPKHVLHFHPSPVVPCPPIKGNVIYPFAQGTYFGLFFTHVFLSDPHPIQQRLLPTCFKCTLNPTTSRILQHWHLSLCCAHMSHRPVTSSFLVALRLFSHHGSQSNPLKTSAKHVPPCPPSSEGFPWPSGMQSPHHGPQAYRIQLWPLVCSRFSLFLLMACGPTGLRVLPWTYQGLGPCCSISWLVISLNINICRASAIISIWSLNKLHSPKRLFLIIPYE